jgi:hypothetical protein
MANVFGSIIIVATINAATANPINKITDGSPSLYITIKKEKYTKARPVSLCKIVSAAGNKAIAVAISCERIFEKSVSGLDKYFANARDTNILQNSAGWKLNAPIFMMDSVPLMFE